MNATDKKARKCWFFGVKPFRAKFGGCSWRCRKPFEFKSHFAFIGSASFFTVWQSVTGATPAAGVLHKNATRLQFLNVSQGCIIGTLGQLGVFGSVHEAFKIIISITALFEVIVGYIRCKFQMNRRKICGYWGNYQL